MCGLLTEVASLVAGHGLSGARASVLAACGLSSCGSRASEHRLNSCGARTQLPGSGIKPVSPASASGFFTTELLGNFPFLSISGAPGLGCSQPYPVHAAQGQVALLPHHWLPLFRGYPRAGGGREGGECKEVRISGFISFLPLGLPAPGVQLVGS